MNVISCAIANPQTLAEVPLEVDYGQVVFYEPIQERVFQMNPQELQNINISVTDEYGNQVSVPNNTPLRISMTLIATSKTFD
jgi:hypothetical protein